MTTTPNPVATQNGRHPPAPSTPPPSLHLDPTPTQAAQIIDAFSDPTRSYNDIAAAFNTSTQALSLWLSREDINKRLDIVEFAIARRARLLSTNALPTAIEVLHNALKNARSEEANMLSNPESLQAAEQRRRSRETINHLAKTLHRLTTLTPPAKRAAPGTQNPFNPTYSPDLHATWEANNRSKTTALTQRAGQTA